MAYTETEIKVRNATNEQPWGPTGQQMSELAAISMSGVHFAELMGTLWSRMYQDNLTGNRNWRRTYKSLLLLDYLIKNGSEQIVTAAQSKIQLLRRLENYVFVEKQSGKDTGSNVRQKAKKLIELLSDNDRICSERQKARLLRDKFVGISSDSITSLTYR